MISLYARSNTLISWAIRLFTWSPYSHVAVLEPSGKWVNEARYPKCRRVRLQSFLRDNSVVVSKAKPCSRPDLAIQWFREQTGYDPKYPNVESEGLPYDTLGIFGFLFHRNWTSPDKWFCSEAETMCYMKGHHESYDADEVNRITPFLSWILPGKILHRMKG